MSDSPKLIEGIIPRDSYAGKAVTACIVKARGIIGEHLVTFQLIDLSLIHI